MKGKKFYIILIGLIAIGIGSVFLYRQQQEARFLEFEGYELSTIEERVEALYDEDKTDYAPDISEEELEELGLLLAELKEKDLGRQNIKRVEAMQEDFIVVQDMMAFEEDISDLFVEEEVIHKNSTIDKVEEFEAEIGNYEDFTVYYDRNVNTLEGAKQQVEAIETATAFVDNLFDEEEVVNEEVTREDEEEALELIEQIKNEEVQEELANRLEVVSLALTEREEILAQEELEALEEEEALAQAEEEEETDTEVQQEQEAEVEEPTYTAPTPPQNTGQNTGSSNSSGSTSGNSSNNSEGSSNPAPQPEPTPEPQPEPPAEEPITYTETQREVIPYKTIYHDDKDLEAGRTYPVNQNYSNGQRVVTIQITIYPSGDSDRKEISSETITPVVHREIIRGTREAE